MGAGFTVDPYRDPFEGGIEMNAEEPDAMYHSAHVQLKPKGRHAGSPSTEPPRTPRARSKIQSRAFNPPRASPPAS